SRGLSIVDVSQFRSPILFGQLDLPGDSMDVSVDGASQMAVVAAGSGGLHFVDVANPMQPMLVRTLGVNATQVEVVRGIAYVALGSQVWSYDVPTGNLLQMLSFGGTTITGLSSEGLFLYTMDSARVLHAIDITDPLNMAARDSIMLPAGGGRLFVGDG